MFLLSAQNNFYVIMSSYVERHAKKKFKFKFHVFGWFPGLQTLHVFFGKFRAEQVSKSFLGRIIPWNLLFFDFLIVFHLVMKSRKSRELWLDEFWGNRHLKMPKISAEFFLSLSCHYRFTNCLDEILDFAFSNIIPRRVSSSKILTFWD